MSLQFNYMPRSFPILEGIDGGWPVPFFRLSPEALKAVIAEAPRITISSPAVGERSLALQNEVLLKKLIAGGIRMPHLHIDNEIVLLDKPAFQNYLKSVAKEVANIKDITDMEQLFQS